MEDIKLELFTKFFTLEKGESNTLELFDFCTPFLNQKMYMHNHGCLSLKWDFLTGTTAIYGK